MGKLSNLRNRDPLVLFVALLKKAATGHKRAGWAECERAVIGIDVLALHSARWAYAGENQKKPEGKKCTILGGKGKIIKIVIYLGGVCG